MTHFNKLLLIGICKKNTNYQLKIKKEIPEVNYSNFHEKQSDFEIVTNHEVFVEKPMSGANRFKPHRIHFYAILFIKEGEGNHFVDFKTYQYKKGSILFIAKDQVHAFEWNLARNARFMLFTEDFFQKSRLGSTLIQKTGLFNYHLNEPLLQLNDEQYEVFHNLVTQIEDEYSREDDFATEEIILSSLRIFLCLAERIRQNKRTRLTPSIYQEEFSVFQKLLNSHLFESRKVQFYADKMNISSKKLNRITRDILNLPAKEYIHDVLIIEIKRFLMNTTLSAKEISYKTGFEEVTNFVKYFKKYSGMTPSQFKKKFHQ